MPADPDGSADASDPRITLLGPQREPRLEQVMDGLGLRGARVATITAGWRDREAEDGMLTDLLGGRALNLRLWERMQQMWEADPELARADVARRRVLTEMQELYLIGLQHAVEALDRIRAHEPRDQAVQQMAVEDTLRILRELDERHVARVSELHEEFYATYAPQHREVVVRGRTEVARLVAECDAVVITGGHVGVLLGALHIFNLAPVLAYAVPDPGQDSSGAVHARVRRPVVAWGAGAMALTERVLLFYDDSVVAPGVAEVLMDGLGLTRGLVALPSARDRLDAKNSARMHTLASRCFPRLPLPLDAGDQVTLTAEGRVPRGARVIGDQGTPVLHTGAAVDRSGEVLA